MNHRGKGELKFCSQVNSLARTASDLTTHMLSFEVPRPSLPPSLPPFLTPFRLPRSLPTISYPSRFV